MTVRTRKIGGMLPTETTFVPERFYLNQGYRYESPDGNGMQTVDRRFLPVITGTNKTLLGPLGYMGPGGDGKIRGLYGTRVNSPDSVPMGEPANDLIEVFKYGIQRIEGSYKGNPTYNDPVFSNMFRGVNEIGIKAVVSDYALGNVSQALGRIGTAAMGRVGATVRATIPLEDNGRDLDWLVYLNYVKGGKEPSMPATIGFSYSMESLIPKIDTGKYLVDVYNRVNGNQAGINQSIVNSAVALVRRELGIEESVAKAMLDNPTVLIFKEGKLPYQLVAVRVAEQAVVELQAQAMIGAVNINAPGMLAINPSKLQDRTIAIAGLGPTAVSDKEKGEGLESLSGLMLLTAFGDHSRYKIGMGRYDLIFSEPRVQGGMIEEAGTPVSRYAGILREDVQGGQTSVVYFEQGNKLEGLSHACQAALREKNLPVSFQGLI